MRGVSLTEIPTPGQRPPEQRPLDREPPDRDPPDSDPLDRDPLDGDPLTETEDPCGQTNTSENITFQPVRLREVITVTI